MNCTDVDHALLEESLPSRWAPQVRAHLRECARCQQFLRTINVPASSQSPSTEILREIQQTITADLRPVRPMMPQRYVFVALIAIFVGFAGVASYHLGAFGIKAMHPFQAVTVLITLAISAALLAYSLACQIIPGSRHRISARLLPAGVLGSLIVVVAISFPFQHERTFWVNAWGCLRTGTAIGAIAMVPFWLILRRGAILCPAMTGAAAGLIAGIVGASVLEIHCPNMDAWHILASHVSVAALGAMAGVPAALFMDVTATGSLAPQPKQSR